MMAGPVIEAMNIPYSLGLFQAVSEGSGMPRVKLEGQFASSTQEPISPHLTWCSLLLA